jgi:hypothetical protein
MNDGSPLLLAGTLALVFGLGLALVHAVLTRHLWRAVTLAGAGAVTLGLYATLLLATSARSRELVLPPGEPKWFCGFYLDCHIGIAAERLVVTPSLGGARAAGAYWVITLRVRSSARRAVMRPHGLRIELVDAEGRRYLRSAAAEAALSGPGAGPLERPLTPGASYTVDVVFDVPAEVRATPRLLVTEGPALQRLVERVLVGDEDSFGHKPTLLMVPAPTVS